MSDDRRKTLGAPSLETPEIPQHPERRPPDPPEPDRPGSAPTAGGGTPPPVLDRFDPPPSSLVVPEPGTIHVWSVPLDPPRGRELDLRALLDRDELQRADRFRFDIHRRRFTVGRGVLRLLLGRYLGVSPEEIRFRYGPKDKPYLDLAGGHPRSHLQFNLSNSEDLAVVAFAEGEEVGADVERLRPMPDALDISERFFSIAERRSLRAVLEADPPEECDRAFFRCWTRKEAYLKAVGTGITVPLDRFDVTLGADEEPRVLAMEGDAERAAAWNLYHLEPGAGYVGAVAIRGGPWRLRGWRWEG